MALPLPIHEHTWLLFWGQVHISGNLGLSLSKPFKDYLRKKKMSPRFLPSGKIKKAPAFANGCQV